MKSSDLFLASDAAVRSVIERVTLADFDKPAAATWSKISDPTIRDVLQSQAYDEAWIPRLVAGVSPADGDDLSDRDLLGDDHVAAYGVLNDAAKAAVQGIEPGSVFRFTYGDYPAEEGLVQLSLYRAFQAWSIAKYVGIPFRLSPEIIAGMNEHVVPNVEEWRTFGVFGPAVEAPADADEETQLLCTVGIWVP